LFIRGIGQADFILTADPGVGVYVDGVYVARSVGSLIDLVDVERVEVLRGPQGTLFGRNTVGGAISLTSKKPGDEFGGTVKVSGGEMGLIETKGSLNVPVSDTFGFRLSGLYREQDGYVDALQYGGDTKWGAEEVMGARVFASWTPSSTFSADFAFDWSNDESGPSAFYVAEATPDLPVPPSPPAPPFRNLFNLALSGDPACLTPDGIRNNPNCYGAASTLTGSQFSNNALYVDRDGNTIIPKNKTEVYGASATLTWDIGDFEIKSITGFRGFDAVFNNDTDFSPFVVFHNLNQGYEQEQFSQELQLVGSVFDGSLDIVLGAYYFDEDGSQSNELLTSVATVNGFPNAPLFLADLRSAQNESQALFGQATWHLLDDRLHLTAGLRYTDDVKDYSVDSAVNPTVAPLVTLTGQQTSEEVTPMFNASYDFSENVMGYLNYSEGFRNGGFPPRITGTPTFIPSYDPEFAEVWEAGVKSTLFDGALRLNAAYFHTSYDDIQVAAVRTDLPPELAGIAIDNLAAATLQGFELEANWLVTNNLRVDWALGYLDAEIDALRGGVLRSSVFPITTDNELPYTPDITSNLGVSYYVDLENGDEIYFRGDWKHIGDQYLAIANLDADFQEAYDIVNLSATYAMKEKGIDFTIGVKNATDEVYS